MNQRFRNLVSSPALAAVTIALSASPAGSQSISIQPGASGGPGSPLPNGPPAIQVSLVNDVEVDMGSELSFVATATDPDGDLVTLRLLNPLPGMYFEPVVAEPSGASRTVRWMVADFTGGLQHLVFEAHDDARPALRVQRTVSVRVMGGSYFGEGGASGLLVGDVTGDGRLDVVTAARGADIAGVQDAGAVYVWAGRTRPAGNPTAALTVPGAVQWDNLGALGWGSSQGIQLADVTGDATLDLVVAASNADVAGVQDAGAIYVWGGGAGLVGALAPTATLTVPGAVQWDSLGFGGSKSQSLQLVDVTGDGRRDIVAVTSNADVGGVQDAGAIYVWAGGAGLVGASGPLATLTVPGAVPGDMLGSAGWSGESLRIADLDADGVLDIVVASSFADVAGTVDTGVVHVWVGGGTLAGNLPPTATLHVPGAASGDFLGDTSSGSALLVGDVTGDGKLDVVAGANLADTAAVDAGGVYVWAGGGGLAGTLPPTATLSVPGAVMGDQLGHVGWGTGAGLALEDVSGDGLLDVVAGAAAADVAGVVDAGAIYVWAGGPGLTGALAPTATLTGAPASTWDRLCDTAGGGAGLLFEDLDLDGIQDVVAVASGADIAGVQDVGALYLWLGGPWLTGVPPQNARRIVPGAVMGDQLGSGTWRGVQLVDVDSDGQPDQVAVAVRADVGGVQDVGAIYVWYTGAGSNAPAATLTAPAPHKAWESLGQDWLGQGVQLADVTGDGNVDVVGVCYQRDVAGATSAGTVYVWAGGPGLAGAPAPRAILEEPVPTANAYFGIANGGWGLLLTDVTGEGVLDVVVGSSSTNPGGVSGAGSIHVWDGGTRLTGTVPPLASLLVPGAAAYDQLCSILLGHGLRAADVTGDGRLDVLAGAASADVGGVQDTGAAYLWSGRWNPGAVPLPRATFTVPGASPGDWLGY